MAEERPWPSAASFPLQQAEDTYDLGGEREVAARVSCFQQPIYSVAPAPAREDCAQYADGKADAAEDEVTTGSQ